MTNSEAFEELRLSHEAGKATDRLAEIFTELIDAKLSRQFPPGELADDWLDDLRSAATVRLLEAWRKFSFEKSEEPLAYFGTVIGCSFTGTLFVLRKREWIGSR